MYSSAICFLSTILILTDDLWIEETEKRYCPNHITPMNNGDVANQIECQLACNQRVDCIGISYSHKTGSTGWCYKCLDDVLEYADNGFGFYRKPGNYNLNYVLLISIFSIIHLINIHPYLIMIEPTITTTTTTTPTLTTTSNTTNSTTPPGKCL